MKFFLWVLGAYGITQIIVETQYFDWLKNFFRKFILTRWIGEMFDCILCTSVWVGFLFGAFFHSPTQTEFQLSNFWISIFLDGMISSAAVWFLHVIEKRITSDA